MTKQHSFLAALAVVSTALVAVSCNQTAQAHGFRRAPSTFSKWFAPDFAATGSPMSMS